VGKREEKSINGCKTFQRRSLQSPFIFYFYLFTRSLGSQAGGSSHPRPEVTGQRVLACRGARSGGRNGPVNFPELAQYGGFFPSGTEQALAAACGTARLGSGTARRGHTGDDGVTLGGGSWSLPPGPF